MGLSREGGGEYISGFTSDPSPVSILKSRMLAESLIMAGAINS